MTAKKAKEVEKALEDFNLQRENLALLRNDLAERSAFNSRYLKAIETSASSHTFIAVAAIMQGLAMMIFLFLYVH